MFAIQTNKQRNTRIVSIHSNVTERILPTPEVKKEAD